MGFQLNYYDNANEQDYRPIAASGQVGLPMLAVNGNLASARHDLFNGNIGSMFTGIQDEPSANPPGIVGHGLSGSAYQYDQLNRIVQSQFFDNYNPTSDTWNANAGNHQHFQTSYSYDGNGNLLTLNRSGNLATGGSFDMDQLTYDYDWGTNPVGVAPPPDKLNRLRYVADNATLSGNYANDIDGTANFSDSYDLIGRLISHTEEDITSILWDPYQKIRRINFSTTASKPKFLEFFYDGMGNRTLKSALYDGDLLSEDRDIRHTWHVHDASGNVVSTYQMEESYQPSNTRFHLEVRQSEVPLYGSARLGLHLTDRIIRRYYTDDDENGYLFLDGTVPTLGTGPITSHSREVGHKAYELPNHLGNVLATVSDRKWPVFSEPKPGKWQFEHFQAELLSASEYYPFGMEMPGRIASSESYRYGFNGMEKDDEVKGSGNSLDFGARIYDPRIGRWLSRDALEVKFPGLSAYVGIGNNPVVFIDPDGKRIFLGVGNYEALEVIRSTLPPEDAEFVKLDENGYLDNDLIQSRLAETNSFNFKRLAFISGDREDLKFYLSDGFTVFGLAAGSGDGKGIGITKENWGPIEIVSDEKLEIYRAINGEKIYTNEVSKSGTHGITLRQMPVILETISGMHESIVHKDLSDKAKAFVAAHELYIHAYLLLLTEGRNYIHKYDSSETVIDGVIYKVPYETDENIIQMSEIIEKEVAASLEKREADKE